MLPTIDIDEDGNIQTIYSDELDLHEIGTIHNVRRASNVDFDEVEQLWHVKLLDGTVIYKDKNREKAIEEEIKLLSPGGKYYAQ